MDPWNFLETLLQSAATGAAAWLAIKVELRFIRREQDHLWSAIKSERGRMDTHLAKHSNGS